MNRIDNDLLRDASDRERGEMNGWFAVALVLLLACTMLFAWDFCGWPE